jgi:hypothetical protein
VTHGQPVRVPVLELLDPATAFGLILPVETFMCPCSNGCDKCCPDERNEP